MDWDTDWWTIEAMRKQGGSFVKALAEAAARADSRNLAIIKRSWPEYWEDYSEIGQKMRYAACPEGMCDGSGEVATDEFDSDSGQYMRGVGTGPCLCRANSKDHDDRED